MAVGDDAVDEKVTLVFLGLGLLVGRSGGNYLGKRRSVQGNSPNEIRLRLDQRKEMVVRDAVTDERVIGGFSGLGCWLAEAMGVILGSGGVFDEIP